MSKTGRFEDLPLRKSSVSLFGSPIPYESKPLSKTLVITPFKSDNGSSVPKVECIEDCMDKLIALNFQDVTLSNLVDKGVDSHSLDMIDSNKLGCDAVIDGLSNHIIEHSSDYVQPSKSSVK